MGEPETIDFEAFAARHGASALGFTEPGMHKCGRHQTDKMWRRIVDEQTKSGAILAARREGLRAAYAASVAAGDIIPPTHFDRMLARANGHPDLQSTQAARRVLLKRYGVDHHGCAQADAA